MKLLLLTLFFIALAIGLGYEIQSDSGYVMIHYHQWQIESSIWVALCALVIAFFLLYFLFRVLGYLLSISKHLERVGLNRRHKKRRHLTQLTLFALLEGQWKKAEKLAVEGCSFKTDTLLYYLAAAYAAHEQHAFHKRDEYLRSAETNKHSRLSLGLCMALLQMKAKQFEQAIATLQNLNRRHPKHQRILTLLKDAYLDLADWSQLNALQPQLQKFNLITEEEADDYILKNHLYQIACILKTDASQLPIYWKKMNRTWQQNLDILHAYLQGLVASHQYEAAVACVVNQQKYTWTPDIFAHLQHLPADLSATLLKTSQPWLKKHPLDQHLLLLLAHCSIGEEDWNQAEHYLDKAKEIKTSEQVFQALALVAEKTGRLQQALHYYRQSINEANKKDHDVDAQHDEP